MIAFAVAIVAGQRPQLLVEALVPQAHFVAEVIAPGHPPRPLWVQPCQLSMSSCSKVPDGPNTRTPASRMASLTSGGAALSANTHAHTSVLSGPLGCQPRKVREGRRSCWGPRR